MLVPNTSYLYSEFHIQACNPGWLTVVRRSRLTVSARECPVVSEPFIQKVVPSPLNCLHTFVKSQLAVFLCLSLDSVLSCWLCVWPLASKRRACLVTTAP